MSLKIKCNLFVTKHKSLPYLSETWVKSFRIKTVIPKFLSPGHKQIRTLWAFHWAEETCVSHFKQWLTTEKNETYQGSDVYRGGILYALQFIDLLQKGSKIFKSYFQLSYLNLQRQKNGFGFKHQKSELNCHAFKYDCNYTKTFIQSYN